MKRWVRQLHRDCRGAISVLMLLTIWCFVALIAMLWNTAEFSMRRQHIQNAADSAAHSAAMWQSRTLNAVTGQNMAICRDASAEAIWRASIATGGQAGNPKSGSIYNELMRERNDALNDRSRTRALQSRLQTLCIQIEAEYAMLESSLQVISNNLKGDFKTQKERDDFANKVRQAQSALDWVENTYLHGNPPSVGGRPLGPGPMSEGLLQLVDKWKLEGVKEQKIFDVIVDYIDTVEIPILALFQEQTAPARAQPLDEIMQEHEASVFAQEVAERDNAPGAIDQQVHRTPQTRGTAANNVEDYYNANITFGTSKTTAKYLPAGGEPVVEHGLSDVDSGQVGVPVVTAFEVDGTVADADHLHTDGIRTSDRIIPWDPPKVPEPYRQFAAESGLLDEFPIDPISPQTGTHAWANGANWPDSTIWHPPMPVYPGGQKYWLNLMVPGGWGHLWLMPLERYLNDRVSRDQAQLRQAFMTWIDRERNNDLSRPDLKTQIYQLQGLPLDPDIGGLPRTLPDDRADDKGVVENIPVLPTLEAPPNSIGQFNSALQLYNTHMQSYLADIRQLRRLLLTYTTLYVEYYISFAQLQWDGAVAGARDRVMQDLTDNGFFMTLATYKLRYIPKWAQATMYATVREQVLAKIVEVNVVGLAAQISGNATGTQVQGAAAAAVAELWQDVDKEGYADEITTEFLSRPWPYEIAPPEQPDGSRPRWVPLGIPKTDRQDYFSSVAVATDQQSPQSLLMSIFGQAQPLVAYAQGECFNWMEFNSSYGGNDQFDNPSYVPYYNFGAIGSPRGWRTCSQGGWNWQPRLSLSDNLSKVQQLNPDIQDLLQKAGISSSASEETLNEINLH